MIIADTNLIAYLLIEGPYTADAEAILDAETAWGAPLLWRSELSNVLSLYVSRRAVTVESAARSFRRATELVGRHEFPVDHPDVLRLAERSGCSSYDCEFVWTARSAGVPLVTADRKLLATFPHDAVSIRDFAAR